MNSPFPRLRCPFCGASFDRTEGNDTLADAYGVLVCHCGRYPIVGGIPVLKKGVIGASGQQSDDIVTLIQRGRHHDALMALLLPPPPVCVANAPASVQAVDSWRARAIELLTASDDQKTVWDLFDFYYRQSANANRRSINYFLFRFSQPRYPIELSLCSIVDEPAKPVLDLACGAGHLTRNLTRRAKAVVGLDRDFFLLYVAKNWLAPKAQYICAEADTGLPFEDDAFSAVFASGAFDQFSNKVTCARELKRLTRTDGVIILATLPTVIGTHRSSLPPADYEALFADVPHRLVPGRDILYRYLQKRGPVLTDQTDKKRLADDPWLSIVASHRRDVFTDYGTFADWPHADGRLRVDPLYVEDGRDASGDVRFRRLFPSQWFEYEATEYGFQNYLPETVSLSDAVLESLSEGRRTGALEKFISQCVVLGFPDRYVPADYVRPREVAGIAETIGGTFYIDTVTEADLIATIVPPEKDFIMVDEYESDVTEINGRRALRFLVRDGQYWGPPADSNAAICEFERLRAAGAAFIVFGWPALWWLEYYTEFARHLYSKFHCVLQNERIVAFDLRSPRIA
jgi:SAM-dependent methyltransferase